MVRVWGYTNGEVLWLASQVLNYAFINVLINATGGAVDQETRLCPKGLDDKINLRECLTYF